jgi:hypothetical protein
MNLFAFFVVYFAGVPIGLALGSGLMADRQNRVLQASKMLSLVASYCIFVAGPLGIVHSIPVVIWAVTQIRRARSGTDNRTSTIAG